MGDHETPAGVKWDGSTVEGAMLEEAGRLLFAGPCSFVTGAASLEQLPLPTAPEIAFAGRSNVGKSSLINALTNRHHLARASNTPGRTQQINFFDLDGRLTLVDLPGYGYAKAPKTQVDQWTRLIGDYLRGRPGLRRVCLLIDSRHGLKDNDRDILTLLDRSAVPYQVVLTKIDKIGAAALASLTTLVMDELAMRPAAHPMVIASSADSGAGMTTLRASLAALTKQQEDAR
jgi:GTP-binding protein